MVVSRQQLYDELWAEPALAVAARYGVSSTYLVRVCKALNVPRPPRGYWAKLEFGKAPKRPILPPGRPGDITDWSKGSSLPVSVKGASPPGQVDNSELHPLLVGARSSSRPDS